MNTDQKVLIADSYNAMLRIIRNLLEEIGFKNIDDATDGAMALEKFNQGDYGLVISEWDLENMDGCQFLESVRQGTHNKNVPFILMSAESNSQNVIKAKNAGVSNFVVKPFNSETLENKIRNVLKS